jgi:hypothetical protein
MKPSFVIDQFGSVVRAPTNADRAGARHLDDHRVLFGRLLLAGRRSVPASASRLSSRASRWCPHGNDGEMPSAEPLEPLCIISTRAEPERRGPPATTGAGSPTPADAIKVYAENDFPPRCTSANVATRSPGVQPLSTITGRGARGTRTRAHRLCSKSPRRRSWDAASFCGC